MSCRRRRVMIKRVFRRPTFFSNRPRDIRWKSLTIDYKSLAERAVNIYIYTHHHRSEVYRRVRYHYGYVVVYTSTVSPKSDRVRVDCSTRVDNSGRVLFFFLFLFLRATDEIRRRQCPRDERVGEA